MNASVLAFADSKHRNAEVQPCPIAVRRIGTRLELSRSGSALVWVNTTGHRPPVLDPVLEQRTPKSSPASVPKTCWFRSATSQDPGALLLRQKLCKLKVNCSIHEEASASDRSGAGCGSAQPTETCFKRISGHEAGIMRVAVVGEISEEDEWDVAAIENYSAALAILSPPRSETEGTESPIPFPHRPCILRQPGKSVRSGKSSTIEDASTLGAQSAETGPVFR